jgi:cell division protease FtsH
VSKLIEEQYQRAVQMLRENKDKLTSLAEKLLEKEVIFKEDLIVIFGERPWDKLTPAEKIQEAGKTDKENSEDKKPSDSDETSKDKTDTSEEQKKTSLEDDTNNKSSKDENDVEEDKSMDSEDTTAKN